MALGYTQPLYILAFDHRGSFQKKMFGIEGDPTAEETERISDAKRLIFEGMELADWLHANDGKFLFELLVPAEDAQLESVGGDTDRYDAELRPKLMKQAIAAAQDFGVEVDVWKIEGVDAREDAEMLAQQSRAGEGREGVVCVLLGRGASDDKVDHWLRQAAPVEGFVGFAIGRSIWCDALKGFLDESLTREDAASKIADNYLRFVKVYEDAETSARV